MSRQGANDTPNLAPAAGALDDESEVASVLRRGANGVEKVGNDALYNKHVACLGVQLCVCKVVEQRAGKRSCIGLDARREGVINAAQVNCHPQASRDGRDEVNRTFQRVPQRAYSLLVGSEKARQLGLF